MRPLSPQPAREAPNEHDQAEPDPDGLSRPQTHYLHSPSRGASEPRVLTDAPVMSNRDAICTIELRFKS